MNAVCSVYVYVEFLPLDSPRCDRGGGERENLFCEFCILFTRGGFEGTRANHPFLFVLTLVILLHQLQVYIIDSYHINLYIYISIYKAVYIPVYTSLYCLHDIINAFY